MYQQTILLYSKENKMTKRKPEWVSYFDRSFNFLTWNCTPVSEGCRNCCAKAIAKSKGMTFKGAPKLRERDALRREIAGLWPGDVVLVNSMSDTYHPDLAVADVLYQHEVMAQTPTVLFLILTKHIERLQQFELKWTDNMWLGVSIESRNYLDRLDSLKMTNALHKFVAFEPLLSAIGNVDLRGTEWIITGGESGTQRRKYKAEWASDLLKYATLQNVPFFYKQGSGLYSGQDDKLNGHEVKQIPEAIRRFRKENRIHSVQMNLF